MAPCQGRLLCCRVEKGLALPIKGSVYTLPELVDNRFELSRYEGGVCLIYRLAPQDCHRYYFCDRGRILRTEEIKGVLHTVRPLYADAHGAFRGSAADRGGRFADWQDP